MDDDRILSCDIYKLVTSRYAEEDNSFDGK